MPIARHLSDQELIDISHHWRRLALAGSSDALHEARRHETELRRRLGALEPSSLWSCANDDDAQASHEAHLPLATAEIADRFLAAAAVEASTPSSEALRDLLHNLRMLLDMDIAFVAELVDGQKIYRHIDHTQGADAPIRAGDATVLDTTLCQRVIDGRLPRQLADARSEPELTKLDTNRALNIGAYLSTPVVLRDGSIYGTLCCISHTARSALGNRQTDALRYVANIVAAELDKHRG